MNEPNQLEIDCTTVSMTWPAFFCSCLASPCCDCLASWPPGTSALTGLSSCSFGAPPCRRRGGPWRRPWPRPSPTGRRCSSSSAASPWPWPRLIGVAARRGVHVAERRTELVGAHALELLDARLGLAARDARRLLDRLGRRAAAATHRRRRHPPPTSSAPTGALAAASSACGSMSAPSSSSASSARRRAPARRPHHRDRRRRRATARPRPRPARPRRARRGPCPPRPLSAPSASASACSAAVGIDPVVGPSLDITATVILALVERVGRDRRPQTDRRRLAARHQRRGDIGLALDLAPRAVLARRDGSAAARRARARARSADRRPAYPAGTRPRGSGPRRRGSAPSSSPGPRGCRHGSPRRGSRSRTARPIRCWTPSSRRCASRDFHAR